MMIISILPLLLVFFGTNTGEISRGVVSFDAKNGRWENAQGRMNRLLMHNPENPELLYDAGVIAARLEKYEQAQRYFEMVGNYPETDKTLQERALFNAGNMAVEQQKYQQAIDYYEKVLLKNAAHEQALYNLEKTKELLKKSEEKNNHQNSKNNNEKNEKKENEKEPSSQQSRSQSHDSKDESSTEQTKHDNNNQQKSGVNENKSGGKTKNFPDERQENEKNTKNQEQRKKQDHKTSEKRDQSTNLDQDKKVNQKKQEKENNSAGTSQESSQVSDKEIAINRVLDAIEKHDGDVQKAFGQHKIQKILGGRQFEDGW